jgi:hypothetical protein
MQFEKRKLMGIELDVLVGHPRAAKQLDRPTYRAVFQQVISEAIAK